MFNTLLFLYLPLILATLLWNVIACWLVFRRRRQFSWRVRYFHYFVLLLMLPAMVCDVAGMTPDGAVLLWGAWIYPLLFFIAAAGNLGLVWKDGLRWWLIPVPLFNLWLGSIYSARYFAYLGVPLPAGLEGLLVAYAMAQSFTSHFLYVFFPIANLLPVLLLPGAAESGRPRSLNGLPAIISLLLLGLNLALIPRGYEIAASWQSPMRAEAGMEERAGFCGGVVLRIPETSFPSQTQLTSELARVDELGARAVNLFVHDNLMTDEVSADALEQFLEEIRQREIRVILTADFPEVWFASPPADREEIFDRMRPFHRFLVTRYRPELLVPFIEPYGAFVAVTGASYSAQEWESMLAEAVEGVRDVDSGVRCAVYLGQSDADLELYKRVCLPDSPVDAVGFSFYAVYETRGEVEERLARARGWISQYGQGRDHWVFEFGQSPLTMGGERAQSVYIEDVILWAASVSEMEGACVFALGDYAEKMGLVNSVGRKRPAYQACRRLFLAADRGE